MPARSPDSGTARTGTRSSSAGTVARGLRSSGAGAARTGARLSGAGEAPSSLRSSGQGAQRSGSRFSFEQPPPPSLDLMSAQAVGAYSSVRQLRASYAGGAYTLRRSSDDDELEVGFDVRGMRDSAAVARFCGSADGHVSVLRDQSVNGRDYAQPIPALQPKAYDGATQRLVRLAGVGATAMRFGAGLVSYLSRSDALGLSGTQAFTIAFAGAIGVSRPSKTPFRFGPTNHQISLDFATQYNSGNPIDLNLDGNPLLLDVYSDVGFSLLTLTSSPALPGYHVLERALGASIAAVALRHNGVALVAHDAYFGSSVPSLANTESVLGAYGPYTSASDDDYSAWFVFGSVLSASDRELLERELAVHAFNGG